ncbi:MAG TPA: hypothetical protein VFS77_05190 [Pyrinomonadaceae bacterium]|nr:hypothetical protein [Pyrinomonadaceae bacterium]
MSAITRTTKRKKSKSQHGFSLMQLLITVGVVAIVSAFAVYGIASARQRIRLTNSSRMLASYVEKARVDSVRRHPTDPDLMAGIEVLNTTTYRVKMDFNGDGSVETKDFNLDEGVVFATDPIALVFDWRGRLVDLPLTEIKVSIAMQWGDDANDQRVVDVTRSGDVTIDSDVYLDDVPNVNVNVNGLTGIDGGSTSNGNNNPTETTPPGDETPTDPGGGGVSPIDPGDGLPIDPGGDTPIDPGDNPQPDPDPDPEESPNPDPEQSPDPGAEPTPTSCLITITTSPNPLTFSKHTGGTVAFSVNPSGVVDFTGGPNNLGVTRVSGNTFQVSSLNNTRGNFTLNFNTPCGARTVSVSVTN